MTGSRRIESLLVVLIVLLAAFSARAEWIPAGAEQHVEMAGERFDLDVGEPNRWFSAWSIGDGQAFAVIAADPTGGKLLREVREPAYRFTRAGFGWLAALFSLGQEPLIPYGMFAVGAIALIGTLVLALHLRETIGPRAYILVLNPALYIGFAGDTAEPLGLLFLTASVAFGWVWASFALGMTRPTFLVALLGRWRQLGAGVTAVVLLSLYSLWRFGADQFVGGGASFDVPLAGYFDNPTAVGWVLGILALATGLIGLRERDWAWVAASLMVISFSEFVTANPANAWRAAGLLPVLWAFGPNYESRTSLAAESSVEPAGT